MDEVLKIALVPPAAPETQEVPGSEESIGSGAPDAITH
jgi:hypothetical protein